MRLSLALVALFLGCSGTGLPANGDGGANLVDAGIPDASGRSCSQITGDVLNWFSTHQSCSADRDCTALSTRCGLPSVCGETPINLAGAAGLSGFFSAWDAQMCGANIRCAPCPPKRATVIGCNNGLCGVKEPASCSDLSTQVKAYLADPSHRACMGDLDCVASATDCGLPGVCGVYINTQSQPGLAQLVAAFNQQSCASGPCPDCAQPAGAGCHNGLCGPK